MADAADVAAEKKREAGLAVIEPEPHGTDVVARLEKALNLAKEGQISSVGIALVYRDGAIQPDWSDAPSMALLIGAVSRLEWCLNQELDGG